MIPVRKVGREPPGQGGTAVSARDGSDEHDPGLGPPHSPGKGEAEAGDSIRGPHQQDLRRIHRPDVGDPERVQTAIIMMLTAPPK